MFRTAELGRTLSKDDFHSHLPTLRGEMLDVQNRLRTAPTRAIVVFAGVDKAGKSETANVLNEWMDPRWLVTRAYGAPSDEMIERPEYWRYWRDLPAAGRVGLFLSCWYSRPVLDRVYERSTEAEFDEALDRIIAFERCLADDGAVIAKFWMHLSKKAQKDRLTDLEKDPLTRWRVTQTDWDHWHMSEKFVAAAERVIIRTSTGSAPWHIVEGFDKRYRAVAVAEKLRDGIRRRLDAIDARVAPVPAPMPAPPPAPVAGEPDAAAAPEPAVAMPLVTVLNTLDVDQKLDRKTYKKQLEKYQGRLNQNCRRAKELGISTIVVFEGWDAAGKGGAIRRVTAAIDARDWQVIPIAAPNDEERAHHYLWRFWRHLSRAGRLTIFDRSWYGRVLVERVEGFASEAEWQRAYAEINDFEDQLVSHGIVLCKFWLHITPEEQLARFQEREATAYKRWKLTDEDWRNRNMWTCYEAAVNDMVEHTSTTRAPWTLVEANDKLFCRIKILKTLSDAVNDGIARHESEGARAWQVQQLRRSG